MVTFADKLTEGTGLPGFPVVQKPAAQEVQEAVFQTDQVVENARESLDFLCALAMPTVYEYVFPPKYLELWAWFKHYVHLERDFSQLAVGLPRGFSKTTLFKLACLYAILFTERRFILIVCASLPKSISFISDVMDMLKEPNIKAVFGDYSLGIQTDRLEKHVFTFRGREIVIGGIGSGGDPRGLNEKHRRPDLMIMDDMQSKEVAESQAQSEALERWMVGTLMKAKSPRGCLYIFVGNMYPIPYHSILRKLKSNRNWVKFIAGGILADGTSLWEELQPVEQLLKEYENDLEAGHPEIFFAEVLNDETASSNHLIDLSLIPDPPYVEGDLADGNFIVIDPASGKLGGDDVAIGYFEVYDATPCLMKVRNGKFSPGETIREALNLALQHNCRLIAIESVAYQSSLAYWFQFICNQLGIIGIEAVEIYPGGNSKNSRIKEMLKAYRAGEISVALDTRAIVHNEVLQFNPLKRDNVDNILDLLTYASKVLNEFSEYIVLNNTLVHQDESELYVLEDYENSSF